ncbi:MAG: hypothetical protein ACO1QB_08690 [Verrucomicrobiales bacterium]
MKSQIETRDQLELGFDGAVARSSAPITVHKKAQANWWFGKMRQIVDLAIGPKPEERPRPEQTYLSLNQKSVWY